MVVKFAPVRDRIKQFLVSLREWPVQKQLRTLSGEAFAEKAAELARHFRPFEGTPDDWAACRGSEPHLRGFPCSLWTLFHTMMTNAALDGDVAMKFGGPSSVARAMVNYIRFFFSCRHCADNFAVKVNSLGYLPATPQDSVMWLWQIHNMANSKLKGV